MSTELLQEMKTAITQGDIPVFVSKLFALANFQHASDIHIEPLSQTVSVRLRIDGNLRRILDYALSFHNAVVAKMKILANLKIDEQRIPQDGRINVQTEQGELDLRVSTFPTINGEKIVIRIVDKSKKIPSFDELGIEGYNRTVLERSLANPVGILLTTGPTGSGKTTTLYACLQRLKREGVNIVTIEDPIEIRIDGLSQSQVQPQIGYTFASGFRSILRQDPDIVMVGEVRDEETLDVAIEAALTGHLVLSTIHTNSAAQTITRMIDLGEKNFLIAATVNAIIAQRLVRRICDACKEPYQPSMEMFREIKRNLAILRREELAERLGQQVMKDVKLFKGTGCAVCEQSGYRGRIGLFEVLVLDEETKQMVLENQPADQIEKVSVKKGMVPLQTDGILKVLQGKTTIEEVYRVVSRK